MKKNITAGLLVLTLVALSVFLSNVVGNQKNTASVSDSINVNTENKYEKTVAQDISNEVIFFYGDGCPHCAVVEKYIADNGVKEKVSFEEKEIYYNQENLAQLQEVASGCGIPSEGVGVPFLWTGKECLLGSPKVINFFETEISK